MKGTERMMTDLEITKLCAEAMGLRQVWQPTYCLSPSAIGILRDGISKETYERERDLAYDSYDPLHDDAQAMALVKKFHLQVDKTLRTPNDPYGQWIVSKTDKFVSEPTSDLNRAICECVAKMQKRTDAAQQPAKGGK